MNAVRQFLTQLMPKSIALWSGMLVFCAVSICQFAMLIPFIIALKGAAFEETRNTIEHHWRATIDPREQNRADENERVGKRLVVINAVAGGAIYDGSGSLLTAFGETPYSTLDAMERGRKIFVTTDGGARTDYFFSSSATRTPFQMIIRVDTSGITLEFNKNLKLTVILVLVGSLAAGLASFFFVRHRVGHMSLQIANALAKAAENPAGADRLLLKLRGKDEMAKLSRIVDDFMMQIAEIWVRRVEAADKMLAEASFGAIIIESTGEIVQHNPAAGQFLREAFLQEDGTDGRKILIRDIETGASSNLAAFSKDFAGQRAVLDITSGDVIRTAIAASVPLGSEGRDRTYAVLLGDITSVQAARLSAEAYNISQAEYIDLMRRRETEMKMNLDASMSLIQAGEKVIDTAVEPVEAAQDWCREMAQAGILKRYSLPSNAPAVAGSVAAIRSIFRNALMLGYASTGRWPIEVEVEGRGINFETVGFTITTQPSPESVEIEDKHALLESALPLMALRNDIRRCKGQLVEVTSTDDITVIKFVLRGVAEYLEAGQG